MEIKDFSGIRNNSSLPDPHSVNIPEDSKDLLNDYVESANSMLDKLEQAALSYEAGNNSEENTAAIRRVLHKIKGEASMVGIEEIAEITHQAEYAFDELNDNQRPDMLLRYKDWVCHSISTMA
jgi:chemotaxis protein histidine kinase CheA